MPNDPDLPDVANPANYIPPHAIAFGGWNEDATFVDADHPLPVRPRLTEASSVPLAGSASTTALVGPFAPEPGRPVWLTLSGTWTGSVAVRRSVDGGTTTHPLTAGGTAWAVFTRNACEQVLEESEAAATLYLDLTVGSGTVAYRVAQ